MVSRIHSWISGEVLTAAALNAEFDNLVTAGNTVGTDSVPGPVELATAGEINTGTDASRVMTPDAFAGSVFGVRLVGLNCFAPATNCATGDGKAFFPVPPHMSGMNLVGVSSGVYTAGTTNTMDIQVRRVRSGVSADMLTSKITHASGALVDRDCVINTSNDDILTDDEIAIDFDALHTTPAKGSVVVLAFQLP